MPSGCVTRGHRRSAAVAVLAGAAFLVSGCGSTPGVTRDEAEQEALLSASDAARDPNSGLLHHRIVVASASQRKTRSGDMVWVVRLHDTTAGGDYCVTVSRDVLATDLSITPCKNPARRDAEPGRHASL